MKKEKEYYLVYRADQEVIVDPDILGVCPIYYSKKKAISYAEGAKVIPVHLGLE